LSKILIFGNSGSGKSTLAKDLASKHDLGHLDLDTVAWEPSQPTIRRPQDEAKIAIKNFTDSHPNWVIEGCYADLLGLLTNQASEAIFLNLSIQACIANAKSRSWEPHKYASKQAQDANLDMLITWIAAYDTRQDSFSRQAHEKLFKQFSGKKTLLTANQ
jgi:adenylate kinase family enzyme